jgi:superfamily I DNA/RNA helicase
MAAHHALARHGVEDVVRASLTMQVPLMTVHKSKGLEFHTMVFFGLDSATWWSLEPNRPEELNSFFVAFTRAEQRAFFTSCSERGNAISWIDNLLAPAGVIRTGGTAIVA